MNKILACFFVFMLLVYSVLGQTAVDEVAKGMGGGDVTKVAQYFDKVVDITVSDQQSTYSKSQAEMVLKNFFAKNKFKSFFLKHKGAAANNGTIFVIGDLSTVKGGFNIFIMFKQRDNAVMVQEIRIIEE